MAAIDNLETATAALTEAVDEAITKLNTPPAPQDEARVQAAADKVAAEADRLKIAANL